MIRLRERDTLKLIGIGQKRRIHMTENRKIHAQEEDRRYTQVFEARFSLQPEQHLCAVPAELSVEFYGKAI